MAISAQGTVFSIESAVADTFTAIGEVLSWSGPDPSFNVLDPTNIGDTYRRKGVGLMNPGTISADLHLNYGDAGQDHARSQMAAKARAKFKLTIPAGTLGSGTASTETVLTFYGYIVRFPIGGRVDSLATASITVEIDGAVTES